MAIMDDEQFKVEMLGLLKEMQQYFSKEDAFQERAKLDKPPKIGETQKNMSGGDVSGAPGQGVAKGDMVKVPAGKKTNAQDNISAEGAPMNQDFSTTDGQPAPVGNKGMAKAAEPKIPSESESSSDDKDSEEELKSLLKDIKSALMAKSDIESLKPVIKQVVDEALKSQAPGMMEKAMTKMGFHPSKPDIRRFGIDIPQEVKKSEETQTVEDIDKNLIQKAKDVDDLQKKSWRELGQLREQMGGFGNLF